MSVGQKTQCPGCGLSMPLDHQPVRMAYFNASRECWGVYTKVLEAEYSDVNLFRSVHQLTVDAYAAQHPGGPHPDKSIDIHLCGLHLVLERGLSPTMVPQRLQHLVKVVPSWPHFPPPPHLGVVTVMDVASCNSHESHADAVRAWAASVWNAWRDHHVAVADLAARSLIEPPTQSRGTAGRNNS